MALATLLGCAEIGRPTFPAGPGPDSIPPEIQITAPPPADTIVPGGTPVTIGLTVRDPSRVKAVEIGVTGATAFNLPDQFPDDSVLAMLFVVPTSKTKTGRVTVRVDATDAFENGSTKTFAFVVK